MSIYNKALVSGVSRIFALPRLSFPLILTLGLTLGAVLSVIAISSTLLFKPLQGVKNEDRIQTFEYRLGISDTMNVSYWDMRRLADFNESYQDLGTWAGITTSSTDIVINNTTYPTNLHLASNTILEVLGTQLIKGQDVNIDKPESYIWISDSLWRYAFSGSSSAIGNQITIEDKSYVIAGVIEDLIAVESATPVSPQQVWLIKSLPELLGTPEVGDINNEFDSLLLRGNSTNTKFPSKAETIEWVDNYIRTNVDEKGVEGYLKFIENIPVTVITSDYRSKLLGDSANLIVALFIAVIGLLLMATLNLLNLFIAHYQGRTKEFAIQLTLGASLFKVRLLVLLENLPSFVLAAITGLLVTGWVIKILPTISNNTLPMVETINIDVITILASFTIILLLAGLFSALALVDINKGALAENLSSSGKGLQAQSNQWLSRILMIVQLSIASILLTASVMLAIQSYDAAYRELGYEIGNSYTISLTNTDDEWVNKLNTYENYQDSELRELHEKLRNIIETTVPNSNVIINSFGPLSDNFVGSFYFPEDAPAEKIIYQRRYMTPDFFKVFNIKMLAGSAVTAEQIANNERRVVLDEAMAKHLFPSIELSAIIGKSVKLIRDTPDGTITPPFIVNGIVAATHNSAGAVNALKMPVVFYSALTSLRTQTMTVMMPKGKELLASMIASEIQKNYPRLINLQVQSLNTLWREQTTNQRVSLWVVLTMTGLTLLLAAIGVAGLTQMTTNHRKYELAVRMATGAKQIGLIKFILKDTVWMLVIGLGLGFIISVAGYQEIQNKIEMLPDFNWTAMSSLDLALIIIVLTSVMIPAWQVIRSDPMKSLREE